MYMNIKKIISKLTPLPLALCLGQSAFAGPYAPAAGQIGSTAIAHNDPGLIAWATGATYNPGSVLPDANFRNSSLALGPAKSGEAAVFDAVSLGAGGEIILDFAQPIVNGSGADFAVFENSFNDTFLELGYVFVSDGSLAPNGSGKAFLPFDSRSLTSGPVNGFGGVDPTNIDGLAGKYRGGFGTPFDLSSLNPLINQIQAAIPGFSFDLNNIVQVKIVDVIGNGSSLDTSQQAIYDPYPTSGSVGFDLDAIGVIHQLGGPSAAVPIPGILVPFLGCLFAGFSFSTNKKIKRKKL